MQRSWLVKRAKPLIDSHQNLNQLKVDERAWELAVKRERELRLSSTLIFVWLGLNEFTPESSLDRFPEK